MEIDKKYIKSRIRLNLKYIANQGWNQIKVQKIKDYIKLKVYNKSRMKLDKKIKKIKNQIKLKSKENQGLD